MIECPSNKPVPSDPQVDPTASDDVEVITIIEMGADGPMGPQGPIGPEGPPGEGSGVCGSNLVVYGRTRTTIIGLEENGDVGISTRSGILYIPIT